MISVFTYQLSHLLSISIVMLSLLTKTADLLIKNTQVLIFWMHSCFISLNTQQMSCNKVKITEHELFNFNNKKNVYSRRITITRNCSIGSLSCFSLELTEKTGQMVDNRILITLQSPISRVADWLEISWIHLQITQENSLLSKELQKWTESALRWKGLHACCWI